MRKPTVKPLIDLDLWQSVRSRYPNFQGNDSEFGRFVFQMIQADVLTTGQASQPTMQPQSHSIDESDDESDDEWMNEETD